MPVSQYCPITYGIHGRGGNTFLLLLPFLNCSNCGDTSGSCGMLKIHPPHKILQMPVSQFCPITYGIHGRVATHFLYFSLSKK